MANSRKILTFGALGVAALALIGTGAGASFTDGVHETQSIQAGTMGLTVSGPSGSTVSPDGKTITLPTYGPTGSTFESTKQIVTITNNGNIPAAADTIQMTSPPSGNANDNALGAQTNVCIMAVDPGYGADVDPGLEVGPWTEGNGPLAAAVALTPTVQENPTLIQPGGYQKFWVTYYAGKNSANCAAAYSSGSITAARWFNAVGHSYQTPDSLTNAAQGGTITPTMTFSFTG